MDTDRLVSALVFMVIVWFLASPAVFKAALKANTARAREEGLEYIDPVKWLNPVIASYLGRAVLFCIVMTSLARHLFEGAARIMVIVVLFISVTIVLGIACFRAARSSGGSGRSD